ncbi:hypothetical protein [Dyadobacter sp. 3J3]|uniref:hypothetical protein n=1 Tax=Dyadobacter sp. 3J3 TaxID=2606600 RepID=UPI0013583C60|nr:hypothetical protein [Dyadobacter sp. 3J3]
MFGSETLEVAIGIIFVFLMVSIICSAIREGIESWLKSRAASHSYQQELNSLALPIGWDRADFGFPFTIRKGFVKEDNKWVPVHVKRGLCVFAGFRRMMKVRLIAVEYTAMMIAGQNY